MTQEDNIKFEFDDMGKRGEASLAQSPPLDVTSLAAGPQGSRAQRLGRRWGLTALPFTKPANPWFTVKIRIMYYGIFNICIISKGYLLGFHLCDILKMIKM